MTDYFGDAGYWIALIGSDDELHEPASRYERLIAAENARIITTQLVLNEVLNPRSDTTRQRRQAVVDLVDRIERNPNIAIEPQTPELFKAAFNYLRQRLD